MDPISVAVPQYEEVLEESFSGSAEIAQFYDEGELDPISVAVPQYEEDLEVSFSGPAGIAQFYDEDEQAYYEGEGYEEPITEPLELSAAHSGNPEEVPHEVTVSGHTQLDEDASDDWKCAGQWRQSSAKPSSADNPGPSCAGQWWGRASRRQVKAGWRDPGGYKASGTVPGTRGGAPGSSKHIKENARKHLQKQKQMVRQRLLPS